jgi:hypothetical protein
MVHPHPWRETPSKVLAFFGGLIFTIGSFLFLAASIPIVVETPSDWAGWCTVIGMILYTIGSIVFTVAAIYS